MKKELKKSFTLVELLVVIAILAVLATVAIIGYTSFLNKANISNDTALVTQLNNYLVSYEAHDGKFNTVDDAVDSIYKDTNINLRSKNILTTKDLYLGYDLKQNKIILLKSLFNDAKFKEAPEKYTLENPADMYLFVSSFEDVLKVNASDNTYNLVGSTDFSVYLTGNNYQDVNVLTSKGLDTGSVTGINSIKYNNTVAQSVIFNTNGGTLTINGANDTIYHYGFSTIINVLDVNNTNCYDECGTVLNLLYSDDNGKINIRSNAKVYMYQNLSNDTNANLNKIFVDSKAIVYSSVNNGESLPEVDSVDEIEVHKHTENFDVFDEGQYTYVVCKHCGNYAVYDNDGFNDKMSSSLKVGPGASSEFVLVHAEAIYLRSQVARLDIGDSCEVSAYFYPSNPTIQKVKWESSDPSVISVEGHGNYCTVTGLSTKANGARANVIARVIDGGDPDVIWASYTIEVHRNPEKPYVLGDFVVQSLDDDETITVLGFSDEKLEEIKNNPEACKNVIFPKNTIQIKEYAFAGLDCIETISFQEDDLNDKHVIDIENGAFFGCSNIKEVNGNVHNINIKTGAFALFGVGKRIETEFKYCNFTISTGNVGIDAETYGSNLEFTSCIFHFVANPNGEVKAVTSAVLVSDSSNSTMDTTIKFSDCKVIIDPIVKDNDVALVQFAADNNNTNVVFDSACLFTYNDQDATPLNFADNPQAWIFYCVGGNKNHSLNVYATKESEYEALLKDKDHVFKYSGNYDVQYFVNDSDDFEDPTIEYSGEVSVDTYDKFITEINSGTHETIIIDGKITKSFNKDEIIDLNGRTLVISEYLEFLSASGDTSITFKNGTIKSANANSIMQVYSIHVVLNNITLAGDYDIFYTLTDVDVKDEKGNDIVNLVTDSFNPTQDQGGDTSGGNQDNDYTSVSDSNELSKAFNNSSIEKIKLSCNIDYTSYNDIKADKEIDLNGFTLTFSGDGQGYGAITVDSNCSLTIKNGTLVASNEGGIWTLGTAIHLDNISFSGSEVIIAGTGTTKFYINNVELTSDNDYIIINMEQ